MTMPHMTNCEHQGDGWCLECVRLLFDRCTLAETHVFALQNELKDAHALLNEKCGNQAWEHRTIYEANNGED